MTPVKCVVWDLDETLWDGTLSAGDDVTLKPGIADLVRTLDARGILQSVASKNNHDDALRTLTDLGIAEYFLHPQINWNSKSSSITALRARLDIGLDTFLFVDDQEFERDEVAFVHPEVETVDAKAYLELGGWPRLSPARVTDDARHRRLMYLQDEVRARSEAAYEGPREDFLRSLGMVLTVSRAGGDDLLRLEELTRRTNQLNSTGIHYSYDDLERLMADPAHDLWVCALTDRYGSYGKVGMALVGRSAEEWRIKLLLMSCRTVSKGVGTVLLHVVIARALDHGVRLTADFRRTDRNRQMLMTYQLADFRPVTSDGDDRLYEYADESRPVLPDHVRVEFDAH